MALKNNTWKLNQWYDQSVAGNAQYSGFNTGEFWTWGTNEQGQLGQNNTTDYSSPKQVPGTTWVDIIGPSAETQVSGGLKSDGTLWMWGAGNGGRLGVNNTTYYSSPVQIPGTTWKLRTDEDTGANDRKYNITSQGGSTYAIKTDGTLWAWGFNSFGILGQNQGPGDSNSKFSSPVQIPGTTWKYVHYGRDGGFFGLKTDGTLWAMGRGQYGRLGLSNTINYSSPTQIPGTTWRTIGGSAQHVFATKTDGTLWGWGNNNSGQLGANISGGTQSSPIQIPGTNWRQVGDTTADCSIAIKTDGTLWGWGRNEAGSLGLNQAHDTKMSSPTQIGSDTDWLNISNVGENSFIGVKTDGTLWAWGENTDGRLGLNGPSNSHKSSPVQIPGTWGAQIGGMYRGGNAIKTS